MNSAKKLSNNYIVGIDVGGTYTRMGIVDENFGVSNIYVEKTAILANDFPNHIIKYIQSHQNDFNIISIFIGFPGVVDNKNNKVISVPNQKKLEGIDYVKKVQESTNIPVYLDNDVNFLLAYDVELNKIADNESVLGFYVGTGFGNAVKINDRFYYGEHGAAGEIGHVTIPGAKDICGCGKVGCVETIASGVKLKKIHEEFFPNTNLEDIFTKHKDDEVMQDFVRNIALVIAMEITILDIYTLVLGGGVISMQDFPKTLLEENIKKEVRQDERVNNLKIFYSESKPTNGIIGAGIVGIKRMRGIL